MTGLVRAAVLMLTILAGGCAGSVQDTFWASSMVVARDETKRGNYAQAEIEYERALWRARAHLGDAEISETLYRYGLFLASMERYAEAEQVLEEAVETEERNSGPASAAIAYRLVDLAKVYNEQSRWPESQACLQRLEPMKELLDPAEQARLEDFIVSFEMPTQEEIADLTRRANAGDGAAAVKVGRLYEAGKGVPKDMAQALVFYELAADQGDVYGLYNAGIMYNNGRGAAEDPVRARILLEKAARGGHAWAQYVYSGMLENGRGGPADEQEAAFWLRESAGQGFGPAVQWQEKQKREAP